MFPVDAADRQHRPASPAPMTAEPAPVRRRSPQHAGVTTATDLVNDSGRRQLRRRSQTVTGRARLPGAHRAGVPRPSTARMASRGRRARARARQAAQHRQAALRPGQDRRSTARSRASPRALRWPGYFNGAPNGIWVHAAGRSSRRLSRPFTRAGFQLHIHTNGDEATELAHRRDRSARSQAHPRPDHRHTLQHCQMADARAVRAHGRGSACASTCSPTTSTTGATRTTS